MKCLLFLCSCSFVPRASAYPNNIASRELLWDFFAPSEQAFTTRRPFDRTFFFFFSFSYSFSSCSLFFFSCAISHHSLSLSLVFLYFFSLSLFPSFSLLQNQPLEAAKQRIHSLLSSVIRTDFPARIASQPPPFPQPLFPGPYARQSRRQHVLLFTSPTSHMARDERILSNNNLIKKH